MKQYEIWWATLPLPAGRRPVLLLSRTSAYAYMNKVVVAEVTNTVRNIPIEVPLGRDEGLRSACVANMDNIRTLPLASITEKIGTLSVNRHRAVKRALGHALDWDELREL